MIRTAMELFRERGVSGTGLREVNARSGVARGAIYHHFPGGKAELTEEVVRLAAAEVAVPLRAFAEASDPVATVSAYVAGWRAHLTTSDFGSGCPVAAVVSESAVTTEGIDAAAGAAFREWQGIFATSLRRAGVTPARAKRLALLAVTSVEGAVLVCRAEHDTGALDDVGRELAALFRQALASA